MRASQVGNRFRAAGLGFARQADRRGGMLIALVQSIIGTFHEDLAPLDQARSEEACDRADYYFLQEGRVHLELK